MLDDVHATDLDSDKATGGDLAPSPEISSTETTLLVETVGFNRLRAQILREDYEALHERTLYLDWQMRSAERARAGMVSLLEDLADLGFSWRDIARMVGVSVPALQKWRRGEKATGERRGRVASLLAACDLIRQHYLVEDVAQWFEIPLLIGGACPVTPADIYAAGQATLVFAHARGDVDPEQLLTEFDPGWRERFRSDFETFRSGDDELSIRPKESG